ncbi:DUF1361 domain-containing protein [Winogradskyella sp. PC D3.3]
METIKTELIKRFKTLSLITVALLFSAILLLVRVKLNNSFFFLFLIWNVFLAIIPFSITMYLTTTPNLSHIKLAVWCIIWLAFLPNAPYIVTDLIHIRIGNDALLWLDVLVVLSFALSGLLLFYISITHMQQLVLSKFKKFPIEIISIAILFLCGFGVYLGRFLRYNTWEIISQPHHLFKDILTIVFSPFQHYEAWLFTLGFGAFLTIGYFMFKNLNRLKLN